MRNGNIIYKEELEKMYFQEVWRNYDGELKDILGPSVSGLISNNRLTRNYLKK